MSQPGTWPTPPAQDEPDQNVPAENVPAESEAPPPTVRRRQRMVPRPPSEDEGVVVNRDFLTSASRSTVKPQTRRNRQLVGTLPDWEPLPPGEVRISKPHVTT